MEFRELTAVQIEFAVEIMARAKVSIPARKKMLKKASMAIVEQPPFLMVCLRSGKKEFFGFSKLCTYKQRVGGSRKNESEQYYYDKRKSARGGHMLKRQGERCVVADVYQGSAKILNTLNAATLQRRAVKVDEWNAEIGTHIAMSRAVRNMCGGK